MAFEGDKANGRLFAIEGCKSYNLRARMAMICDRTQGSFLFRTRSIRSLCRNALIIFQTWPKTYLLNLIFWQVLEGSYGTLPRFHDLSSKCLYQL
jgi:hypothetical protein